MPKGIPNKPIVCSYCGDVGHTARKHPEYSPRGQPRPRVRNEERPGKTLEWIAEQLGLSTERVRQIEKRALAKMKMNTSPEYR